MIRFILGVIFVFLFVFNTHICDYFYDYNIFSDRNPWMNLRFTIYEIMFLISCFLIYRVGDLCLEMIFAFGGTLVIGSLIDKLVFNTYSYHLTDIASCLIGAYLVIKIYNTSQNEDK